MENTDYRPPENVDGWHKAFLIESDGEESTTIVITYLLKDFYRTIILGIDTDVPIYRFKTYVGTTENCENAIENFYVKSVWMETFLMLSDLSVIEIVHLYPKLVETFPVDLRNENFDETSALVTLRFIDLMLKWITDNGEQENLPEGGGGLFGGRPPSIDFKNNLN